MGIMEYGIFLIMAYAGFKLSTVSCVEGFGPLLHLLLGGLGRLYTLPGPPKSRQNHGPRLIKGY